MGKKGTPRTFLFTEKLYAHFDFLDRKSIGGPYDFAPRLAIAALHANGVADPEIAIYVGKQRTASADVAGAGMLGERPPVGTHSPDPKIEVYRYSRLGKHRGDGYAHRLGLLPC